jgi:hypothetical protein
VTAAVWWRGIVVLRRVGGDHNSRQVKKAGHNRRGDRHRRGDHNKRGDQATRYPSREQKLTPLLSIC